MERIILHSDLNTFYASVECLYNPEIRNQPMAVAGNVENRHGIILAKNELAKAFHVNTGEPLWMARQKCPQIVFVPPHYDLYLKFSQSARSIYADYSDYVESFGLDECWLDVTPLGDGKAIADEIRQRIRTELGVTASVGVSFNKVFAKLGSDYKKPDATTVISRDNYRDLIWPLPVTELLFVGRAAARTLSSYGIETIGDLAAFDKEALMHMLGRQGAVLHDYATGAEHAPVVPARDMPGPKSVGNGLTFRRNLLGWSDIQAGVSMLSDSVAARLRSHGLKCATVQVTIRSPDFKDICRQKPLDVPSCLTVEISGAVMELIRSCWDPRAPIRALTITGQNLIPEQEAAEQLNLFSAGIPAKRERLERLERTVDGIRGKYGKESIRFAAAQGDAGKDAE